MVSALQCIISKTIRRQWKRLGFLLIGLLALTPIVFYRPPDSVLIKIFSVLENPQLEDLAFNILQARTSMQKAINIAHIPYWFHASNLPIYDIYIDPKDIEVMNNNLPDNVFADNLVSKNKVFVPATFASDGYRGGVDIRYRGALNSHWSHAKRSLLIKFPKNALFNTMKSIDLIVPRDRAYLIELINNERLKRNGLVAPNMFFVWVRVNNKDAGVYLAKERFSASWLEKNRLPSNGEIFSQTVQASADTPTLDSGFPTYNAWRRDVEETNASFEELETLFSLARNPDDAVFQNNIGNILDLEKWYRAIVINLLAGGTHSLETNLNLFFNTATGKLEPLLEDIHIYAPEYYNPERTYQTFDLISRRILSNQFFYEEYLKVLKEMTGKSHLDEDLSLYESFSEDVLPEFYKDQTKYRSDFQVANSIEKMREWIIGNYGVALSLANIQETPVSFEKTEFTTEGNAQYGVSKSYGAFYDTSKSPQEFAKANPAFRIEGGGLAIGPGSYTFTKTIIIPRDTKLTIYPGTKLYLAKKTSLISYSPITAIGSRESPILIARAEQGKNWGAVAIINTEEVSVFNNVTMVGGSSSRRTNGVTFTGMLSAHNAPLEVGRSQFYKDADDDMINVKYAAGKITNSQFFDSAGDAIDIDMSPDFLVQDNTFSRIGDAVLGGDAIDLSFTNARIAHNTIKTCSDKGVSVGEKSTPRILGNVIENCKIGIAVKDMSRAVVENNTLLKNTTGIALYQKKDIFGGGEAVLANNVFAQNKLNIDASENSTTTYVGKK